MPLLFSGPNRVSAKESKKPSKASRGLAKIKSGSSTENIAETILEIASTASARICGGWFVGSGETKGVETSGAWVSTVKVLTLKRSLGFPAESVTVIVQSEYVPSDRESNVIVLSPATAEFVTLEHDPPYEISPSSLELNV